MEPFSLLITYIILANVLSLDSCSQSGVTSSTTVPSASRLLRDAPAVLPVNGVAPMDTGRRDDRLGATGGRVFFGRSYVSNNGTQFFISSDVAQLYNILTYDCCRSIADARQSNAGRNRQLLHFLFLRIGFRLRSDFRHNIR